MPRKLKVYQTSMGFFDQAVAAPSMKAALDAWGASSNLFHHGVAKETDDPEAVAAAMSKPGVVFRRQVGTSDPFTEHADVSADVIPGSPRHGRKRTAVKTRRPERSSDEGSERKAAQANEREQQRRERERQKKEAIEEKRRERRERAIAAATKALEMAESEHSAIREALEDERATIDKRLEAEDERWQNQKDKLDAALQKARDL